MMDAYREGLEQLAKWSQRKIQGKTALMIKRIKDVTEMYAEKERRIISECEDTARKLDVPETNAEGMAQILKLVLGSNNIDTAEPAPPLNKGDTNGTNGHVDSVRDGTAGGVSQEGGGSRGQLGQDAGDQAVRPAGDGAPAQAGGKRSRGKAGSAATPGK